jgi:glycosyltransferase involved in cell wall biosynthesis
MISVIIPMYNSSSTIVNALESVRKQKYIDALEIIIVNDGSTDSSLDVVNLFRSEHKELNIKVINKINGGVASARNVGINKANGEFIALLDSDDEWIDNKLNIMMPYFDDPGVECLGSARNDRILKVGFKTVKRLIKIYPYDLVFRWNPQTSSVVFRREVIEKIGTYNEKMRYAEDGEYWLRIAHYCGFYVIPDSLVTTGNGKHEYGDKGLSGNLREMHTGELSAIDSAFTMGSISLFICFTAKLLAKIKYLRRKLVVRIRKK